MKRSKAGVGFLSLTLLLCPFGLGCAIENSALPGEETLVVRAYSRNAIVAVPTMAGNMVGSLVAAPAVVAFYAMDGPEKRAERSWRSEMGQSPAESGLEFADWVGWTAAGPVYFAGGLLGTSFVPLSLLAQEQRYCLGCSDPDE